MSFKYLMNRESRNHIFIILLDFSIWGNTVIYCSFQNMQKHHHASRNLSNAHYGYFFLLNQTVTQRFEGEIILVK